MKNNKYKILLVEDDGNIRTVIAALLETSDYQVIQAETGAMAETLFSSYQPDLIILDLGLPDMDGMEFISFVRKESLTPVIVLSARTNDDDKVRALDEGANDYVTKPFSSAELLARVRTTLRNYRHSSIEGKFPGGKFKLRKMEIDYDARQIFVCGEEIKLSQTEYNIVALLSEHCGKMMTYSSIIKAVWGLSLIHISENGKWNDKAWLYGHAFFILFCRILFKITLSDNATEAVCPYKGRSFCGVYKYMIRMERLK